jgi:hypothetical protein
MSEHEMVQPAEWRHRIIKVLFTLVHILHATNFCSFSQEDDKGGHGARHQLNKEEEDVVVPEAPDVAAW